MGIKFWLIYRSISEWKVHSCRKSSSIVCHTEKESRFIEFVNREIGKGKSKLISSALVRRGHSNRITMVCDAQCTWRYQSCFYPCALFALHSIELDPFDLCPTLSLRVLYNSKLSNNTRERLKSNLIADFMRIFFALRWCAMSVIFSSNGSSKLSRNPMTEEPLMPPPLNCVTLSQQHSRSDAIPKYTKY